MPIPNFSSGSVLTAQSLNDLAGAIRSAMARDEVTAQEQGRARRDPIRVPVRIAGDGRVALANDAPPGYTNPDWGKFMITSRSANAGVHADPRELAGPGQKFHCIWTGPVYQRVHVDRSGHVQSVSCAFLGNALKQHPGLSPSLCFAPGAGEESYDPQDPSDWPIPCWGRWWDGTTAGGYLCGGGYFTRIIGCIRWNNCSADCARNPDAPRDPELGYYYFVQNDMDVPTITVNTVVADDYAIPLVRPLCSENVSRVKRLKAGPGITLSACCRVVTITGGAGSRPINPPGQCVCSLPLVGCTTPCGTHIRMLRGYGDLRTRIHPPSQSGLTCQIDLFAREIINPTTLCDRALHMVTCQSCCTAIIREVLPAGGLKGCAETHQAVLWTQWPVVNVTGTGCGNAAIPGQNGWVLSMYLPHVQTSVNYNCTMNYTDFRQLMRFMGSRTGACLQVTQQYRLSETGEGWQPGPQPAGSCTT